MKKNNEQIWYGLGALITSLVGYFSYPYVADLIKDNIEFTQWVNVKDLFPVVHGLISGVVVLVYFIRPLLK